MKALRNACWAIYRFRWTVLFVTPASTYLIARWLGRPDDIALAAAAVATYTACWLVVGACLIAAADEVFR